MQCRSRTGPESENFDGYVISSALGGIDRTKWNSLDDQNLADWRESPSPGTNNAIAELKPTTSTAIASGAPRQLGNVFKRPLATEFGTELEDIQFEYYTPDGETIQAEVIYEGVKKYNNLVLVVDPVDGDAILQNQSNLSVSIDGYNIHSASGSLLPNNGDWLSLEDQDINTWRESGESVNDLSELQSSGSMLLGGGTTINLGSPFKTVSMGGAQDLAFRYLFPGDSEFTDGFVVYRNVNFQPVVGDYNGDGTVNAADYTVWRDHLGASVPSGTGADGSGNGVIDAADYQVWKTNFGMSSSPGAAALATNPVPEPSSLQFLALAAAAIGCRRQIPWPKVRKPA